MLVMTPFTSDAPQTRCSVGQPPAPPTLVSPVTTLGSTASLGAAARHLKLWEKKQEEKRKRTPDAALKLASKCIDRRQRRPNPRTSCPSVERL